MTYDNFLLLILILLGLVSKSNIITVAGAIILILKGLNLGRLFPIIERQGIQIGLLFLMLSILVPFTKRSDLNTVFIKTFTSPMGIIAIITGIIATNVNGRGIKLLQEQPQLVFGILIGSLIGIVFFKGIPVGPLMAGGMMIIILDIIKLLHL